MKICMLFPEYGSQFVGMGKELYDESRIMQEFFEEASGCLPINFVKLCFASSDVELAKPVHAYPSLFLISCSIAQILKAEGIMPDAVAGHGIGEYAAMHAAGGLNFPDGLYLLNKYAALYQELLASAQFSSIHVTGVASNVVEKLCEAFCNAGLHISIAIYDAQQNFVVAGHAQAVEEIRANIREQSGVAKVVPIEIGLHSMLMQNVVENFKMYLEKVDFKDIAVPLLACTNGHELQKASELREQVMKTIEEPVRWDNVMTALQDYDLILEVGPGSSLSAVVQAKYPDKKVISVSKPADVMLVKEIIAERDKQTE